MNRLQKKCFIASAGMHLLLVLILIIGPAFLSSKSKIEDIESGLEALVSEVRDRGIASIAIPPLGCGLGGLDWDDVRPRIEAALRGGNVIGAAALGAGARNRGDHTGRVDAADAVVESIRNVEIAPGVELDVHRSVEASRGGP